MSGREWKPGDVVLDPDATGKSAVALVVAPHSSGCPPYHEPYELHIHYGDGDWNGLTDRLRPLVIIDPNDREQVERLEADVAARMGWHKDSLNPGVVQRREAFAAALREFANPTPPKPDEPTGLGAVVEDADGKRWVRRAAVHYPWVLGLSTHAAWDEIPAVRVLSEGVTP